MGQEIEKYINKGQPWQKDVCETLRKTVHDTVAGVEEKFLYGKPHFAKGDTNIAALHVAKSKVSFVLFNASGISEVKGFLRNVGDGDRKVVDVTEGQEVDVAAVADVLKQLTQDL